MKNQNESSKTVILSLLIGGAIGAGIYYCMNSSSKQETPFLKKIGKTLSEIGELLESDNRHLA